MFLYWSLTLFGAGGGLAGSAAFLFPRSPWSRSSQKTFRRKSGDAQHDQTFEETSTVVMVPVTMIQAIPPSGMRPSKMEIKSTGKRPMDLLGKTVVSGSVLSSLVRPETHVIASILLMSLEIAVLIRTIFARAKLERDSEIHLTATDVH